MSSFSVDKIGEVTSELDVALRWAYENSLGDKVLNGFRDDQLRLQDVLEASADDLMTQAQDWKLGAMATRRFLNAVARLRQECSYAQAEKEGVVLEVEETHDAEVSAWKEDHKVEADVSMSRSMTPSANDSMTVSAMSQSDLPSQTQSKSNSSSSSNSQWYITGRHTVAVKNNLPKNGGQDEGKKRLRTRYCDNFFSTGECEYGENCKYAHSVFEKTIVRRRGRGRGYGRGNDRSSRGNPTYKQL